MELNLMKLKMLLVMLLGLTIIGCSTTANYDYDNSVNFNQLKTYAWVVESKNAIDDSSFYLSKLSHRRMINAIDNSLISKGLTKVAPGQADILVNYHAGIDIKLEREIHPTHSFYWNYGHYYRSNHIGLGFDFSHRLREYKEGTLVIDFINNNNELIWRGAKGSRLSANQSPQQRTEKINQTVAKILENFPPQR